MSRLLVAAILGLAATTATGALAGEKYAIDTTHAQVLYSYSHLGYSTTFGMFSGITGTIDWDAAAPAKSSVEATIPVATLFTGDDQRTKHFLSGDFFGAAENPNATFKSTEIEVTGEKTANITGDLTINGITKPAVLAATLTQAGDHPMANKPWLGFVATTTVKRTDYDMALYVPYVGDDVSVTISVEAMKAE